MATYVMSDIHGEADRFHQMLELIKFSSSDRLYILGDVVDRGPDGIALIREIMKMKKTTLLLGNHEYMMLGYYSKDVTEIEIRRWNKNGNEPTVSAMDKLTARERKSVLSFLSKLRTSIRLEINKKSFYLVHGFPGDDVHDEVWQRPTEEDINPFPGTVLIIGHTPVSEFMSGNIDAIEKEMEEKGEHHRILHTSEFIDLDCCCGYNTPVRALACLRLEDMEEFYI